MAVPIRQALRFIMETTPGVVTASPAAGTTSLLRMTDPVTDSPEPARWVIRDAGSSNRRVQTGSEQSISRFKIKTPLFYQQALLLLPAFCTPTGGLPGLTTFTIDHYDALDVNAFTKYFTRTLGATPENLTLSATNTGQGMLFMADMTFVGRTYNHTITATDFPLPAIDDYDYTNPAVFQHAGQDVIVGDQVANFKSLQIMIKNTLDLIYDENATPTPQFYGSRDIDWSLDFRYTAATLRADYESVTARTVSIGMTDGTATITFDLHDANFISALAKERPLDKAFYEKVSGEAYLDTVVGDDLTLTVDDGGP